MSDQQTFITCPHCGEPVVMSPLQHELFRGRALACSRCAKTYTVDLKTTPLYALPPAGVRGRATVVSGGVAGGEGTVSASDVGAVAGATVQASAVTTPEGGPAALPHRGPAAPERGAWRLVAMVVGGFLLLAGLVAAILIPMLARAEEQSHRLQCASNMKQIGAALAVYAAGNGGQYPPTLETLLLGQLVAPSGLVCPSSSDTPAIGATPEAWVLDVQGGGHLSYLYASPGTAAVVAQNPNQIILHEPLTNHDGDGIHVMYANGTVAYLNAAVAKQAIAGMKSAAQTGTGTGTSPTTLPRAGKG